MVLIINTGGGRGHARYITRRIALLSSFHTAITANRINRKTSGAGTNTTTARDDSGWIRTTPVGHTVSAIALLGKSALDRVVTAPAAGILFTSIRIRRRQTDILFIISRNLRNRGYKTYRITNLTKSPLGRLAVAAITDDGRLTGISRRRSAALILIIWSGSVWRWGYITHRITSLAKSPLGRLAIAAIRLSNITAKIRTGISIIRSRISRSRSAIAIPIAIFRTAL